MRAAIAITMMVMLAGCGPDQQEPRDPKVPRPKTSVTGGPVRVEPLQTGTDESQPLIMRAVLRCQLDPQGKTICELDVPRMRARMG